MKIFYDTREQRPLKFKKDAGLSVRKKMLKVGDYGAEMDDGSICPMNFERKSLGDLYGTMTNGYARFKREMERAQKLGIGLIIIVESSFVEVSKGYKHSEFDGRAMIRKLFTLHIKYPDIIIYPVAFTNSRSESAAYIKSYYEAFNKNLKKKGR